MNLNKKQTLLYIDLMGAPNTLDISQKLNWDYDETGQLLQELFLENLIKVHWDDSGPWFTLTQTGTQLTYN